MTVYSSCVLGYSDCTLAVDWGYTGGAFHLCYGGIVTVYSSCVLGVNPPCIHYSCVMGV